MILHFSHIGFTEALTFIAPVFVSTTGLLLVPGVGQAGTNFRPDGPTGKDSRGRASGRLRLGGQECLPQNARQEPRLSVLGEALLPSSPHAPKHVRQLPGRPVGPTKLATSAHGDQKLPRSRGDRPER